jgi:hypothetical protein
MLVTNQYGKRLQFVPLVKIIGQNHQLGQWFDVRLWLPIFHSGLSKATKSQLLQTTLTLFLETATLTTFSESCAIQKMPGPSSIAL